MTPRLPEVSLNTIGQLEAEIRLLGRTASGREATVRAILAGEMIQKLIRIQEEAEDLESLEDLHVLCRVMQTICACSTVSHCEEVTDVALIPKQCC